MFHIQVSKHFFNERGLIYCFYCYPQSLFLKIKFVKNFNCLFTSQTDKLNVISGPSWTLSSKRLYICPGCQTQKQRL